MQNPDTQPEPGHWCEQGRVALGGHTGDTRSLCFRDTPRAAPDPEQSTTPTHALHAPPHLCLCFHSLTPQQRQRETRGIIAQQQEKHMKRDGSGWLGITGARAPVPDVWTKDCSFQSFGWGYYQLWAGFCVCILHRQISHLWAFDLKRKSRISLYFTFN